MLTYQDAADLITLRHALHRAPDLSGDEGPTAARIVQALTDLSPNEVITGLGGHGVAAVWNGAAPGPAVMLRAELDGLPIHEAEGPAHRSTRDGRGHLCGHDGHMAMLVGAARLIARRPPARGRVILLFQPAEETGAGAAAVLADPRFAPIRPDWAFAIHNMPGLPLGPAGLAAGPANCASEGMRIVLTGRTAHASMPEQGVSPAPALARLIAALPTLGPGGTLGEGFRLVTVTHARLGEAAFGIAPGQAELWVTLRTLADADMAALRADVIARVEAEAEGLAVTFSTHEAFAACVNDPQATAHLAAALDALGIPHGPQGLPMRASEDFGRFAAVARTAMVLLGAGEGCAPLHAPDYDFPDTLIPVGVAVLDRVWRDVTGSEIAA